MHLEKEEGASVDGGEGGLKGNEASRQEEPRRGWSFKEKRGGRGDQGIKKGIKVQTRLSSDGGDYSRGDGILNNIEFAPGFLTTFEQQGFCPRCLAHQMQVLVSTKTELNCSTLIYFSHIQSVFSTLRFTLEINLST